MEEQDIYASIGSEGFERLVAAFYRQIPSDDLLGPLYQGHDLDGAERRLRDFLMKPAATPASESATPRSPSEPPLVTAGFNS